MPVFKDSRTLPYSKQQMFELVSDVARYHEFLPWCMASRVYHESEEQFDADLLIGFKAFREKFTSRVRLDAPHRVYVDYIRGPLKTLYNHWQFNDHAGGCSVHVDVEVEFKSAVLERMIGGMFARASERMIEAFEARAAQLYAPVSH